MVKSSTRFITTPKIPLDKLDERRYKIAFLILAAAQNTRINNELPLPLLPIDKQTRIIDIQFENIRKMYPQSDIFLGVGYKADEIYKYLGGKVKTVENERFNKTGATRTLSLLLRTIISDHVVILDGNILFDINAIYNLRPDQSSIITSTKAIKSDKVGVISNQHKFVTDFNFGSPDKWCKITHIVGNDINRLQQIVHDKANEHLCLFESLELAVRNGLQLFEYKSGETYFCDIDSMAELKKVSIN